MSHPVHLVAGTTRLALLALLALATDVAARLALLALATHVVATGLARATDVAGLTGLTGLAGTADVALAATQGERVSGGRVSRVGSGVHGSLLVHEIFYARRGGGGEAEEAGRWSHVWSTAKSSARKCGKTDAR